jgi:xylan 1,4-beta-xylosidase
VFQSRDLVHGEPVGGAIARPEQLDLDGRPLSHGLFAPTIRVDGDRLWIACTTVAGDHTTGQDPACATGPSPA